jgi:hypothetical protein
MSGFGTVSDAGVPFGLRRHYRRLPGTQWHWASTARSRAGVAAIASAAVGADGSLTITNAALVAPAAANRRRPEASRPRR